MNGRVWGESGFVSSCVADVRAWLPILFFALVLAAGGGSSANAATGTSARTGPLGNDPYQAAVAYAECMRRFGIPFPSPDAVGNFALTAADENRLQHIPRARREAADNACYHYLRGTTSTKPLSRRAKKRAIAVLQQLAQCIRGYGYEMGAPVVKDLPRGRAFFGFAHLAAVPPGKRRDLLRVEHLCEKRVDLAGKIDTIIAKDRGTPNLGDF